MAKLKVLFLCTGNSCRSQMAEGFARHVHAGWLDASSAGSLPTGMVDPRAVHVMAELDVDISGQYSKHLREFAGTAFDAVITVCDSAREACPLFPGAKATLHRDFDDPPKLAESAQTDEQALLYYRRVRDEISAYVLELPSLLEPES